MSGASAAGGETGNGRIGVLFVCLGNICRSPLAKGVFERMARARGDWERLRIDSCGTGGWHVGGGADPRTIAVMEANQTPLTHTARRFDAESDLKAFRWILAMDRANVRELVRMGVPRERIRLLREFDPALAGAEEDRLEVPDPYYGGEEGFQKVYDMVVAACEGLYGRVLPPRQSS